MLEYVFGALVSGLAISDIVEYQMNSPDTKTRPPVDTVSIIMASLNEEKYIEQCLLSIRNQMLIKEYPADFEIILVDSGSKDRTVELARPYVDKIIYAPKGKLTARNLATDQSKGNVIISVDADCYYNQHWLNTLLSEFYNPNVVAVHGSTFDYTIPNVPGQFYTLASYLQRIFVRPTQMTGRNSAFYKHLFYQIGKFDDTINQTDVNQMLQEEEYSFGEKLSQFGKVVYKLNASCNHLGGQKLGCRIGTTNKELCNQYGISVKRFG